MQHIKFTYVDAITGISLSREPAANGPVLPSVAGLEFVWARESLYPTDVPEFFGTCPDDSDIQVDGVLGVYLQADWEAMRDDELRVRNPVPQSCTRRQGLLALLSYGTKRSDIEAQIAAIEGEMEREAAQIEYEADTWERSNLFVQQMWAQLGGTPDQLDDLYRLAVTL